MAWKHRHLVDVDVFSDDDFYTVLEEARHMEEVMERPLKKVPALRGKVIANLFFEPSTRTRTSFELAEKYLSADVINWSSSGSSTAKGESLQDTAKTIEAMGVDAVVIRNREVGTPEYLIKKLNGACVINAGDGARAHPTQALLDLYTAWKHFGSLKGRKMTIVGDVLHSRVARSNIHAFTKVGVHVVVSGPRSLIPLHVFDLAEYEPDTKKAASGADIVYALRIQRERQEEGLFPSIDEYHSRWGITASVLSCANKQAIVMHPGPMNRGVEIESFIADGERCLVLNQVKSGVAVRMALLFLYLTGGAGR
ncbi:MAG: aspartate carbamoyltransferase catalytic subunit [Acetomicrobium sp.]|uniref:aspartate carbamoyltransferase catalytic subunit n=1 Tax=Acetomicrobium TaxID=49894 RepID=UPI0016A5106D|nr:aspartate carbamoyltransferase catalytic subunit [Acetomicrobium mobile]MBP8674752.1 aspartate carbamoyltransferase catalytic subunit [Acetomicrobium sp.]NLI42639.1 aspartate carbamoyltransferase catalytic subunit [Synergistaceae bacterium]HOB10054.1 aspartate carbamoyltransferase catalytic subunit [Acetomicrobium sp.]HQA35802.1 aspartate carbamoyltransferase catalytic subunit [Acetomicrobium sp.]HQC87540.1 aspartate carbamoyltransferase catalytic subunit [Acetomicrobium sp.]